MSSDLMDALRQLAREKAIDEYEMLDRLEQSLAITYQRILDLENPTRVTIDRENGHIYVYELVPQGEWDAEAGEALELISDHLVDVAARTDNLAGVVDRYRKCQVRAGTLAQTLDPARDRIANYLISFVRIVYVRHRIVDRAGNDSSFRDCPRSGRDGSRQRHHSMDRARRLT